MKIWTWSAHNLYVQKYSINCTSSDALKYTYVVKFWPMISAFCAQYWEIWMSHLCLMLHTLSIQNNPIYFCWVHKYFAHSSDKQPVIFKRGLTVAGHLHPELAALSTLFSLLLNSCFCLFSPRSYWDTYKFHKGNSEMNPNIKCLYRTSCELGNSGRF